MSIDLIIKTEVTLTDGTVIMRSVQPFHVPDSLPPPGKLTAEEALELLRRKLHDATG